MWSYHKPMVTALANPFFFYYCLQSQHTHIHTLTCTHTCTHTTNILTCMHPSSARQWYYQTCTEFGYFKTTDSDNQPFGNLVNLDSFTDVCYDVFNITQSAVLQAVNNTNNIYGGKNISTNVTNIVFPNGSIDPWHALGITQNITDQLPAIFIEGTSHCADMLPPTSEDLPGLTSAREEITTLIGTWLMV